MNKLKQIFNKIKQWFLHLVIMRFYPEMPFCVYPVFRKGKAGYDSFMIKGYSYTLLKPNKGTENVIHLMWNDFKVHEEDFIDEEDDIHKIEDSEQPFFKNWIDAYNDALNAL